MDFGTALQATVSHGAQISRDGWNGKGMYVWLHHGFEDTDGEGVEIQRFLMMKTVDGTYVPWTVSQTDVLADDWTVTVGVVGRFDDADEAEGGA